MDIFNKKNINAVLVIIVAAAVVSYLFGLFDLSCEGCGDRANRAENFCGDGCGELGYPYGCDAERVPKYEDYSTCYRRKQIYLSSCDPDEATGHADVNLESRFGKLYITINANLPYAKGGVYHTMWGAYSAFLVDSRNNKSINLGSLVRHGDRFYKLSTELLGEYSNYDKIVVYRQTEDYAPKKVLMGSITRQQCSSL
jgi:hypothetical protein